MAGNAAGVGKVSCVASTQGALDYLGSNALYIVLINWRMETANGDNVHAHLKTHASATCHVLMTERGLLNPVSDEIALAADLCVEKRDLFRELPLFLAARFDHGATLEREFDALVSADMQASQDLRFTALMNIMCRLRNC